MKKIIVFTILLLAITPAFAQNIAGSWSGTLNVGVAKLRLVFNIEEKGGKYAATMDSPDQGAKGIPVSSVAFENQTLKIKADNLGMSYEGVLANDSIKGTFIQMGQRFPLTLTKSSAVIEIRRPQNPVPPYPYRSEEVKFDNKNAGITLAGTLSLPEEGKSFPVAILVSGSGPQNRDEEVFNHKPFLVIADYLTRHGIAVLRYDDRGTAESGGNYKTATIEDFVSDAAAAIDYMKLRKEIDPKKIGLIGHSEGGTIAFMLAAENHNLAYIVSMAGMAVRGDSLLRAQRYLISKAMGVSEEMIALNEQILDIAGAMTKKYSPEYIAAHLEELTNEALPDSLKQIETVRNGFQTALKQVGSAEIQSLMVCDPSEALKKIKCPVLAINGYNDLQVPADMNLNQVKALVKSPVIIKKYPGLNHLFQHCTTGLSNEYGSIEETISPEVLSDIAEWILKTTK